MSKLGLLLVCFTIGDQPVVSNSCPHISCAPSFGEMLLVQPGPEIVPVGLFYKRSCLHRTQFPPVLGGSSLPAATLKAVLCIAVDTCKKQLQRKHQCWVSLVLLFACRDEGGSQHAAFPLGVTYVPDCSQVSRKWFCFCIFII